jgi:DNA (cytosine-5)-methyltransferase 1
MAAPGLSQNVRGRVALATNSHTWRPPPVSAVARAATASHILMLVLSLFPGIDLLGRGFEAEGFCVVRGPDLLWGGDVRAFHPPASRFDGVIGGSPCPDFSARRRAAPSGEGVAILREFVRVVDEAAPEWFLLENVPRVPDIEVTGYSIQRFDLNARECGMRQSRLRHFQFGSRAGLVLIPERAAPVGEPAPICLASEGDRPDRRTFADFCELQGLPRDFNLPGYSVSARYRAVGNGVPGPMARVIARAIRAATPRPGARLCACNCGRILTGKQKAATPACRKRIQRRSGVTRRPLAA